MPSFDMVMVFAYAGFLMFHIFAYTSILDGKKYAIIGEIGKIGVAFLILFSLDLTWYGMGGILMNIFMLYLFCSLLLSNYFITIDQKA